MDRTWLERREKDPQTNLQIDAAETDLGIKLVIINKFRQILEINYLVIIQHQNGFSDIFIHKGSITTSHTCY